MKSLHWTKLPANLVQQSVWAEIDATLLAASLDYGRVEELFGAKPPPAKKTPPAAATAAGGGAAPANGAAGGGAAGGAAGGRRASIGTKAAAPTLHVMNMKRANNISIFLAKRLGGLTVEQLCRAAMQLDASVLGPELLESLLENLPPETEAKALRALTAEQQASLSPPERFGWEMCRVPRLRSMLQALRLKHTLPPALRKASAALQGVADATRAIMASGALVQLLRALLAHGNFLNAGTPRGAAAGFKLDGVDKMASLRSLDGRETLLGYVAAQLPSCAEALRSELAALPQATRVPLVEVLLLVKEVHEGVRVVGHELALCPVADLEDDLASDAASGGTAEPDPELMARRFRRAVGGFHQQVQQGLDALTAQQEDSKALLRKLANFFGEDPNVAKPDMIIGRVADVLKKL